jgi:DNA-binding NtrC family response regulator
MYHRAPQRMLEHTTRRRNSTKNLGDGESKLAILWVHPDIGGRLTFLHSGRTVLGRDFTCDVRLAGPEASRQHAEIMRESAMVVIGDLNSMNGTYVDGRRVSRAPIDEGSVVRIGDWVGVIVRLAGAQDGAVFQEIIPGYFGGPRTLAAVEPLRKVAASQLAIVIEGETGTGKEGIARAAHLWSGRTGPFIAVNCAALPETLAEGELFGYRKGAFTGADRANPGFFQAAQGGTLFLDEVADLPPAIQPKLLRVLEQMEVIALGETKPISLDVRVVVATQRPLAALVEEKRFRADLMARLDGLRVRLLPLGSRVEEVPYLFARLLRAKSGTQSAPALDAAVVEKLCCHRWPLNIRELTNLVQRTVALHGQEKILKRSHLVTLMGDSEPTAKAEQVAGKAAPASSAATRLTPSEPPLAPATRERRLGPEPSADHIREALKGAGGRLGQAARVLGLSNRFALYRLMKKHGIGEKEH